MAFTQVGETKRKLKNSILTSGVRVAMIQILSKGSKMTHSFTVRDEERDRDIR